MGHAWVRQMISPSLHVESKICRSFIVDPYPYSQDFAGESCEFFQEIFVRTLDIIKHHQTSSNIIKHHQTSLIFWLMNSPLFGAKGPWSCYMWNICLSTWPLSTRILGRGVCAALPRGGLNWPDPGPIPKRTRDTFSFDQIHRILGIGIRHPMDKRNAWKIPILVCLKMLCTPKPNG